MRGLGCFIRIKDKHETCSICLTITGTAYNVERMNEQETGSNRLTLTGTTWNVEIVPLPRVDENGRRKRYRVIGFLYRIVLSLPSGWIVIFISKQVEDRNLSENSYSRPWSLVTSALKAVQLVLFSSRWNWLEVSIYRTHYRWILRRKVQNVSNMVGIQAHEALWICLPTLAHGIFP